MIYHPVTLTHADTRSHLPLAQAAIQPLLEADAPATLAMTDFVHTRAVTVTSHRQIDAALQDMIHAGVRSLLVTKENALVGFITSYDIQGEKPLLFIQGPQCIHPRRRHQDVRVEDIMTPISQVPAIALATLRERRLGDLLASFDQHPHAMHMLVLEPDPAGGDTVRGLISHTQVRRLLEMDRRLT